MFGQTAQRFQRYRREWLALAVLAASAFFAFLPALDAKFVNYDDKDYVCNNPGVTRGLTADTVAWAFTTFHNANWHPLTWLSLQSDAELWGQNPRGYHLTNLLIHAANACLVFLALRALTGAFWRSALVALFFAVHPLRVESVAWISERKDVLSAFFGLLSLLAYAYYARQPSSGKYLLVAITLVLSLLCKPMLVTLPFLFLVLDWWPLGRAPVGPSATTASRFQTDTSQNGDSGEAQTAKAKSNARVATAPKQPRSAARAERRRSTTNLQEANPLPVAGWMIWRRLVIEKSPWIALIAASATVTFFAQKHGGAVGDIKTFPLPVRIENAVLSYAGYLGKTFLPIHLSPFYIHPGLPGESLAIWKVLAAVLLLLALTVAAALLRNRAPYLLTGWLWFTGTLVPVIGLVQVGNQGMADRYTYFPQIGLLWALCWAAAALIGDHGRARLRAGVAVAVVSAVGLSVLTWQQATIWQDSVHLWHSALEATGGSETDLLNYGGALEDEGYFSDAAAWYRNTLKRYPNSSKVLANLGNLLSEQGDQDAALRLMEQSLAIDPGDPMTHTKLGTVLFRTGDIAGAIREHRQAVERQPLIWEAWYNLGLAEMTLDRPGNLDRAAECLRRALNLNPGMAAAHSVLGNVLIHKGRDNEGFAELKEAVRCDPDYAEGHINLGKAYSDRKNLEAAADEFRQAIRACEKASRVEATNRQNEALAKAWYNLGAARVGQGRADEAVEAMLNAIERDPGQDAYRQSLQRYLEFLSKGGGPSLSPKVRERLDRFKDKVNP